MENTNFSFSGKNKRDSIDSFLDFNSELLLKITSCYNLCKYQKSNQVISCPEKIIIRNNSIDSSAFKNKRLGIFMKGKKKPSLFFRIFQLKK
jgi:hypothetical protein